MAGSSFFALLDDIATILDDVALMTKLAAKKTAGVLGDDLALNAKQVTGIKADRELSVVLAVGKGSLINKAILVPLALAISALAPFLILPLLMIGGTYLCFEGVEKILHHVLKSTDHQQSHHQELVSALENPKTDIVAFEKEKIKGAVRTDFILSAEIVTIALGTVSQETFTNQIFVLIAISLIMTFGVYGLVGGIVKLDDLGLYLFNIKRKDNLVKPLRFLGSLLLNAAPWLMKFLSVSGTIAMFLVGGGIIVHGWSFLHDLQHTLEHAFNSESLWSSVGKNLATLTFNLICGLLAGLFALACQNTAQYIYRKIKKKK